MAVWTHGYTEEFYFVRSSRQILLIFSLLYTKRLSYILRTMISVVCCGDDHLMAGIY